MAEGTRATFDTRIASTTLPAALPADPGNDTTNAMRRIARHVHEHAEAYLPGDESGPQVTSVSVSGPPPGDDDSDAVGQVFLRDGSVVPFRLRRAPARD